MFELTKFLRCVGCGQVLTGVEYNTRQDAAYCLQCEPVVLIDQTPADPAPADQVPAPADPLPAQQNPAEFII